MLIELSKYPRGLRRPVDILRMTDMPVLAIEILSSKQGIYDKGIYDNCSLPSGAW